MLALTAFGGPFSGETTMAPPEPTYAPSRTAPSYTAYYPVAPVPPAPAVLVTPPPLPVPPPVEDIPVGPSEQPGAGPHITVTPSLPGGPFDIFSAESFKWWKPVLIATGIALFGGTILAIFRTRR